MTSKHQFSKEELFSEDTELKRQLGLTEAFSIVISRIIGSGIFRTPAPIMMLVRAVSLCYGVWILGGIATLFILGVRFSDSRIFQRIALVDTQRKEQGFTSSVYQKEHLIGKRGRSFTILRPSGKVMIEDQVYDAYTRGNYIGENVEIVVISDEGTSLKVKKV